ncbi:MULTISPECIES: DUF6790 family protein [unclassified Prochlorococcus]|uniref:DUF6790 family protein n=1 Tax=Prochlorococcus sp. MIT 0703 TaxID=1499504 RepID=UPI0005616B2C|nr:MULTISPECIES: DUF6790 family protein [unclassified Prochlorococcus]
MGTSFAGRKQPLLWIAFWVMGLGGLYGFAMHIVFGQFIAEQIGWPNSRSQNEVAFTNLTIGILGLSGFGGDVVTTWWPQ